MDEIELRPRSKQQPRSENRYRSIVRTMNYEHLRSSSRCKNSIFLGNPRAIKKERSKKRKKGGEKKKNKPAPKNQQQQRFIPFPPLALHPSSERTTVSSPRGSVVGDGKRDGKRRREEKKKKKKREGMR